MDTTYAVQDEAKEPDARAILNAVERLTAFTEAGFKSFNARIERLEHEPAASFSGTTFPITREQDNDVRGAEDSRQGMLASFEAYRVQQESALRERMERERAAIPGVVPVRRPNSNPIRDEIEAAEDTSFNFLGDPNLASMNEVRVVKNGKGGLKILT